jgi:hypothetical protein
MHNRRAPVLFCFGRPGGDLDRHAQLPSSAKLLGHRCRRQRGCRGGAPLGSEGAVGGSDPRGHGGSTGRFLLDADSGVG